VVNQPYPSNYGFVPYTLSADGDPIDIFVFSDEPLPSGVYIKHNLAGAIKMLDNGVEDNKLIANIGGANLTFGMVVDFLNSYKPGTQVLEVITSAAQARTLAEEAGYNWTRLMKPKWSY
jgi:hypothetical protein